MDNQAFSCLVVAIMRYPDPSNYCDKSARERAMASVELGYLELVEENEGISSFKMTENGFAAFIMALEAAKEAGDVNRFLFGRMLHDKMLDIADDFLCAIEHDDAVNNATALSPEELSN